MSLYVRQMLACVFNQLLLEMKLLITFYHYAWGQVLISSEALILIYKIHVGPFLFQR